MMVKYSKEQLKEAKEIAENSLSRKEAIENVAYFLNISSDAARMVCDRRKFLDKFGSKRKYKFKSENEPIYQPAINDLKEVPTEKTVVTTSPKSVEEVAQLCNVDTKFYDIKSFRVEGPRANGNFSYSISFERKAVDVKALLNEFIENVKDHNPKKFNIVQYHGSKDCMYLLNLQDTHLGKFGWGKSTLHSDYDYKITKEIYNEAVIDLLSQVPQDRIEEIWLVVGSDLIHIDSPKNLTTGGTPVEADTRYQKIFMEACSLMVETIELLASKFKVKGIVVPGNHANTSEFCLGAYLQAWFRNHPNVNIDNEPTPRKYKRYSKNGFMFYHGDKNLKNVASLFMSEFREEIANCKYFEVIAGDKHQERVVENRGIKERIAPSLSGTDFWHSENGFVGNTRQAQGLLYSKDYGLQSIYYSKPVE